MNRHFCLEVKIPEIKSIYKRPNITTFKVETDGSSADAIPLLSDRFIKDQQFLSSQYYRRASELLTCVCRSKRFKLISRRALVYYYYLLPILVH